MRTRTSTRRPDLCSSIQSGPGQLQDPRAHPITWRCVRVHHAGSLLGAEQNTKRRGTLDVPVLSFSIPCINLHAVVSGGASWLLGFSYLFTHFPVVFHSPVQVSKTVWISSSCRTLCSDHSYRVSCKRWRRRHARQGGRRGGYPTRRPHRSEPPPRGKDRPRQERHRQQRPRSDGEPSSRGAPAPASLALVTRGAARSTTAASSTSSIRPVRFFFQPIFMQTLLDRIKPARVWSSSHIWRHCYAQGCSTRALKMPA